MTNWSGMPTFASKRAFHWLNDNRGEVVPCLWIPDDACVGYWILWGDKTITMAYDVACTCEYVGEVK